MIKTYGEGFNATIDAMRAPLASKEEPPQEPKQIEEPPKPKVTTVGGERIIGPDSEPMDWDRTEIKSTGMEYMPKVDEEPPQPSGSVIDGLGDNEYTGSNKTFKKGHQEKFAIF